ncbi:glycoside hydrolase 43 family protein [Pedobacter sp. Hv1]|uniref:glycoside hydrolase family 43 protein n=1 Tax=Pedobacter sp. Hv1 TaxID=1740090 RepID=UPI0006D8CC14|nr:glycoside hydrolase 43 family protein [Pedobacter sp. Hv1]KQC01255.1 glycoside hydrolase [Pedobacter sp. Hv1]
MKIKALTFLLLCSLSVFAQKPAISKVWVADLGNGKYKNPVLDADYSDPDAIRVGDDFYMVSSSFDAVPGLPILHSKDLVNWTIIGHALKRQPPFEHFSKTQHGNGVWAPAIRFYKGEFYIYYPDPDFGIYLTKAKNAAGPWSEPVLVEAGKGLIDPCPLWDEDGKVYLVHGYAGSRAGIKSIIVVKKMNAAGNKVIDEGKLVYDGHELDPTIEGPKFYKRNSYYYIFAPAGGVATGWQLVLRSKNVYGPYERKVVMDQGKSPINGPHQGAWVDTPSGEDWFLHFQDKEAYGRVMHLQPMKWINNWPVIGIDADGDGIGEPVLTYKKPTIVKPVPIVTPAESDEFNDVNLGLQWQWQANPSATWSFLNPTKGALRLYSVKMPDSAKNYWEVPNLLLQKFPTEQFTVTTKLSFTPNTKLENEKTGLIVAGLSYANIAIKSKKDGLYLVYTTCKSADKGKAEKEEILTKLNSKEVQLRVTVSKGAKCQFSYSLDGQTFIKVNDVFQAEPGKWIGAKVGLFCVREQQTNDSGYADFDWFRIN